MQALGERAVVLGASMGGLLAARVLSDFFATVTVIDRDELPDDPVNRRGVPQGRHVHALLARGARILDEFFPGILDELVAAGSPVWDDGDLSKLYLSYSAHRLLPTGRIAGDRKALALSLAEPVPVKVSPACDHGRRIQHDIAWFERSVDGGRCAIRVVRQRHCRTADDKDRRGLTDAL